MEIIISYMVILIILPIYFVPTITAVKRRHNNKLAIIIINVFLGWTFLAWALSLAWACSKDVQSAPPLVPTVEQDSEENEENVLAPIGWVFAVILGLFIFAGILWTIGQTISLSQ